MKAYRPSYKTGGKKKYGKKYWMPFRDHNGTLRRVAGFSDKSQTELLGRQIERLVAYKVAGENPDATLTKWIEGMPDKLRDKLAGFGLLDAGRLSAGRLLLEHVKDFELSLKAKERTPKYIIGTVSALKGLFKHCKFRYLSNITPAKVENYLKDLRDKGKSYRRSNSYLIAIKLFCNWAVKSGYISESPIRHLMKLDVELDRRRERRAATPDEIQTLLQTTAAGPERYSLSGYERALFYKLAVDTGLRKNELRTLNVSAFDFENLTLTVETKYSKHRKEDMLPLRLALAGEIESYLANKLPGALAFVVTDKTNDMFKEDLADADILYIKDGKVLDFHALRHTFITNLRMQPSSVRQSLARHRSSAMTDVYTHVNLADERAAIESLPDLQIQQKEAAATGTDGKLVTKLDKQGALKVKKPQRQNSKRVTEKLVVKLDKKQDLAENTGDENGLTAIENGGKPDAKPPKTDLESASFEGHRG